MQYIYAKGEFLPVGTPFITAEDRSFRFGDGVFETLLVAGGKPYDFASHRERLAQGLDHFRIAFDLSQLEKNCQALLEKNNCTSGYLRITISRGESAPGAVGYLPKDTTPYVVIQSVDKTYPAYGSASLFVSTHRAYWNLPCKVNSAMLYTLAMIEAQENHCDNALILSTEDYICETASANIFWVKNRELYTPELNLPFVPGTMRKQVLKHAKLPVREGRYMLAELEGAEEIFMANVGGLITKISAIEPIGYRASSSEITDSIRASIDAAIAS